jgi:hypothetical protein
MAQFIDLEGLPEPVATAIIETVINLKSRYQPQTERETESPKALPLGPGKVIGSLRRIDLYEDR